MSWTSIRDEGGGGGGPNRNPTMGYGFPVGKASVYTRVCMSNGIGLSSDFIRIGHSRYAAEEIPTALVPHASE